MTQSVDLGWINGRRERLYVAAKTRTAKSAKLAKLNEDAAGVRLTFSRKG